MNFYIKIRIFISQYEFLYQNTNFYIKIRAAKSVQDFTDSDSGLEMFTDSDSQLLKKKIFRLRLLKFFSSDSDSTPDSSKKLSDSDSSENNRAPDSKDMSEL